MLPIRGAKSWTATSSVSTVTSPTGRRSRSTGCWPSREEDAMTHQLHSHCSYCGARYEADTWPRSCAACGNTTWRNPTPVGIALLPVGDRLVGIRRGINPQRGEIALPVGFIVYGESWQHGVCRELHEELGIIADPAAVTLFALHNSVPNGRQILLFGLLPAIEPADLPDFV